MATGYTNEQQPETGLSQVLLVVRKSQDLYPTLGNSCHVFCIRKRITISIFDNVAANTLADDFDARSPDELSLKKGDRLELIEKDDEFGDGWYLGKHIVDGRTGLFPEGMHVP